MIQIKAKQSPKDANLIKYGLTKEANFTIVFFKKWLKDDDIKIYSIRKSVVAERFIRTLKTKIYKYMTSVSKNEYIHKLHNIVDEYNNSHHRTINMKPANVKDNTYIDFQREVNEKDLLKIKKQKEY